MKTSHLISVTFLGCLAACGTAETASEPSRAKPARVPIVDLIARRNRLEARFAKRLALGF